MSSYKRATLVRLSEHEGKRISKMEDLTGKSAPSLLREAFFKGAVIDRPLLHPNDVKVLMVELNRQGNNLNQLAKKVNEGSRNGWSEAFNSLTRVYIDIRRILSVGHARN